MTMVVCSLVKTVIESGWETFDHKQKDSYFAIIRLLICIRISLYIGLLDSIKRLKFVSLYALFWLFPIRVKNRFLLWRHTLQAYLILWTGWQKIFAGELFVVTHNTYVQNVPQYLCWSWFLGYTEKCFFICSEDLDVGGQYIFNMLLGFKTHV